jgi:hypothetical protein
MIQLQLNDAYALGEISAHVPRANPQSGDFTPSQLSLDHHRSSRILSQN